MNTLHVLDKLRDEQGLVVGRETIRKIFKRLSLPQLQVGRHFKISRMDVAIRIFKP